MPVTEYYMKEGAEDEPRTGQDERLEIEALVGQMAEEALHWREENFDDFLEDATKYYRGEPFGNEEKDRSQVVLTVVRDSVRRIMPSLLRVFFGAEQVVEFSPREPEDEEIAKQQTDVVNYIVREDNRGFLVFDSWFKDALIRRLGTIKWWWEVHEDTHVEQFRGLTLEQVSLVVAEFEERPGHEVETDSREVGRNDLGEALYDLDVTVTVRDGRARFDAVPPEEVIWSPSARDKLDARVIGHVADVPADEIIAMGYDEADVIPHAGDTRERHTDSVEHSRRIDRGNKQSEDEQDPVTRPTQFAELWARVDVDGDGIAELRRFDTIGTEWKILNGGGLGEVVDEVPLAFLTYDPEPHAFVGLSVSDSTMDLQRIGSFIARGMLDSLAESIDPVTVFDPDRVNTRDMSSRAVSRKIRVRGNPSDAIMPFKHVWTGPEALQALSWVREVRDERVGVPDAAAGLDPDVLQSTTKAAVDATVTGAQQQLEMTARIFAETGVADLFRGLLGLLVKHQDEVRTRTIRLRNEWVDMDASRFDPTLDVRVNVAIGTGLVEEKLALLNSTLQAQLSLIQMGSPLVSWAEIRSTLAKITELGGWVDSTDFWRPFGPQEQAQFEQQQAQAAQQPDPNTLLLQIEQARVQQEAQEAQAEHALEAEKLRLEDDRERDKMAQEFALKAEEIRAKYASAVTDAEARAASEIARETIAADVERERTRTEAAAAGGAPPVEPGQPVGAPEPPPSAPTAAQPAPAEEI